MLSILIPTYNYNCLPLVSELHEQATVLNIVFEIICLDDCSDNKTISQQNEGINALEHCTFSRNTTNLGRAANRNKLASKAKYEWLLFLDCDTFPCQDSFIKTYITAVKSCADLVFFGGLKYKLNAFDRNNKLRYVYGIQREAIPLEIRNRNIYNHVLTSNILVHKNVFYTNPFNENLKKYGYEDLVFIYNLQNKNVKINNIENAVYHLNLETSIGFIKKYESSIENLIYIEQLQLLPKNHTKVQKIGRLINRLHLNWLFSKIYLKYKYNFIKHLSSVNPSVKIFDLYKLSYYCHLKTK